MPDIFDEIAPEQATGGDVFDEIAPEPKPLDDARLKRALREQQPSAASQFGDRPGDPDTAFTVALAQDLPADIGTALHKVGSGIYEGGVAALQHNIEEFTSLPPDTKAQPGLTTEEAIRTYPKPVQAGIKGVKGLVESAPQMGIAAVNPYLGAVSFGLTPKGFDPKSAAIAAVLPVVGKYTGAVVETMAAKAGVTADQALLAFNKLGGASGAAGLIGADQAYAISQLPAEQREQAIVDAAGNVGAMFLLGTLSKHERPPTEAYTGPAKARAAFVENLPGKGKPVEVAAEVKPGEPVTKPAGDVFDEISPEPQAAKPAGETSLTELGKNTPGAAVATPAVPGASPAAASGILANIQQNKLETQRRAEAQAAAKPYTTEQALKDLPAVVADLKAALERNRLTPANVTTENTEAQSNEPNLQANPTDATPGNGQKVAQTQVLPQTPQGNASSAVGSVAQQSQEFDRLVKDYGPQAGWATGDEGVYNNQLQTGENLSSGIAAKVQASRQMQALRRAALSHAVPADQRDNYDLETPEGRAKALPVLEAHIRQQFPEDNTIAKRRALQQFGSSEPQAITPTQQRAGLKQDAAELRRIAAENARVPELQALGVHVPARAASGQTGGGRARPAGGHVSAPVRKALHELERVFGVRIILVDHPQGNVFHGWKDRNSNVVLLNAATPLPLLTVAGHELGHHIELTQRELYQELADALIPLMQDVERYRAALARKGYQDPRTGRVEDATLYPEIINDFIGDNFGRKEFWDDLRKREPNLFRRLARMVKEWLDKLIARLKGEKPKTFESEQYFSDLEQARNVVTNALIQAGRETQYRKAGIAADLTTESTESQSGEFSKPDGGELFGAPETVEEQRARLKAEAETQKLKKAKEQMQERAAARLVSTEDTRTQDMFGTPEHRTTRQDSAGQGSLFSKPENKVPARFAMAKPIKGPTGASIVGYEWRSMMGEKWSNREGGYVEARVSDWDNADESTGTGRAIVHVFYVEHPDGKVRPEGIRSAQTVLGINETRLMTIAKKERAAQQYRQAQERAEMAIYDRAALPTAQEAAREYRKTNYSPIRSFEENNEVFDDSALFEKGGKFIRRNWKTADRMQAGGWTLVKDDPARTGGTTKAIDSIRPPKPEIQPSGELDQGSLFSKPEEKVGPIWRSNIQDALESWQNKGTPEQLRAHLAKTRGALDEAEWIGLDDFLKDNPSVTKQQVQEFVKANTVDVQEVEKGGRRIDDSNMAGEMKDLLAEYNSGEIHQGDLKEGARRLGYTIDFTESGEVGSIHENSGGETNFENYQLPGGENYRELLLTLPERQEGIDLSQYEVAKDSFGDWQVIKDGRYVGNPVVASSRDEAIRKAVAVQRQEKPAGFTSSHFDEPNILAHVRFNERTDADGKRVLFIEEVQSDWHQKGRKEGYASKAPATAEEKAPAFRRIGEINNELSRLAKAMDQVRTETERAPLKAEYDGYLSERDAIRRKIEPSGIPDAPFKQTWPMLAMKRMIRYASENGFDRIAWTTGEQQAARYDLSKQISRIELQRAPGSSQIYLAAYDHTPGTERREYGRRVLDKMVTEQDLPEYIGKEAAERFSAMPWTPYSHETVRGTTITQDHKVLSGLDLKVGGEGMKGFYDRILPSEVNKFVKKWGGRVARAAIITGQGGEQIPDGAGGLVRVGKGAETVHSLDITPAMKDAAMQGLPMFSKPEGDAAASKPEWQNLQDQIKQAEADLMQAIRVAGNTDLRLAAGLTVRVARNQKNIAAAKVRELKEQLRTDAGFVEYLMGRTKQLQQELNALKALPKEERDNQKIAEVEAEFENLNFHLSEAPKKLVAKIYEAKFMSGDERTEREKAAGSQAAGTSNVQRPTSNAESGEIAPESKAQRIKAAISHFPATLRTAKREAAHTTEKVGNLWSARGNRDMMAATFDAAENGGALFGKQAANEVLHALNRNFGAPAARVNARNPVREMALTFVIESGMDENTLAEFREQIRNSDFATTKAGKQALEAIDFAENHWERLQPVAQLYNQITDAQVDHEQAAGVDTLHRKGGYVFHLTDVLASHALPDIGSAGSGVSSPFLKTRQFATYADAIAAGSVPKSLNAVDLLQRRMSLGQKLINHGAWIDGMYRVIDPKTQQPIVTHTITKVRADGKEYEDAPAGYVKMSYGPQTFAVMRGYDGLFKSLVTPSTIRNSMAGNVLMEAAGGIKHSMLLLDSYHYGRLAFWNAMVRGMGLPGNPFSHKQGLTLLDNTVPEIERMAANGEIPAAWVEDLKESKRQLNLLIANGLNVASVGDNIAPHFVQELPVVGTFNVFLFQKFQRGATAEAALIELRRQIKMNPKTAEATLARRVAKDLNIRFGNLQNQSWIKNKNVADIMRMVFLAPQWNESLIRSELGAVKELGQAPFESLKQKRISIGLLGRAVITAVIGGFIANQIINYITRGHPTWENPEETDAAKLSAYIPDVVGNGPGYFLNPLTLPAEISELLMKKTERTGDFTQAVKQFGASRLGPLGRIPYTLAVREDELGRKLRTGSEVAEQALSSLIPLPISGGAVYRMGKQLVTGEPEEQYPGQFQRQGFQTFGIKLDSAPSPDQRIKALASEFNREKGVVPAAEFFHGDFSDLDRAALIGNKREMADAMARVLEKKTKADIRKHYERWVLAPFTGQQAREKEFLQTLDAEQREQYQTARRKRKELRDEVLRLLSVTPSTPPTR